MSCAGNGLEEGKEVGAVKQSVRSHFDVGLRVCDARWSDEAKTT